MEHGLFGIRRKRSGNWLVLFGQSTSAELFLMRNGYLKATKYSAGSLSRAKRFGRGESDDVKVRGSASPSVVRLGWHRRITYTVQADRNASNQRGRIPKGSAIGAGVSCCTAFASAVVDLHVLEVRFGPKRCQPNSKNLAGPNRT